MAVGEAMALKAVDFIFCLPADLHSKARTSVPCQKEMEEGIYNRASIIIACSVGAAFVQLDLIWIGDRLQNFRHRQSRHIPDREQNCYQSREALYVKSLNILRDKSELKRIEEKTEPTLSLLLAIISARS
jgi:hypothetical protein